MKRKRREDDQDAMNAAFTLTLGEVAENNPGMQKIGKLANNGFGYEDLSAAKAGFEDRGARCQLFPLHKALPSHEGPDEAWVLVVRGGVKALGGDPDELYGEQARLEHDKMALFRGKVKHKRARHNLCFARQSQEPEYGAGKGRVVAFADVPGLAALRGALPDFLGEKASNLNVELNAYYDPAKCGIGFHGDGERKRVVGVRLGTPIPLHFHWFKGSRPIGERVVLNLDHGDLYVFSEKASGWDWKRSSVPTLRHAAGAESFLYPRKHAAYWKAATKVDPSDGARHADE
jgi:hypothetical protein